jgi:uncharacterized protein YdaU (DUF1376 family)
VKPKDKLLAEWFWTDRWNGSSGFLLPIDARGLYREMLTQAWRRGGRLPNDHESIQRACGVTSGEWRRLWPHVARYWRVDDHGDLVNDTQLEVIAEAREAVERNKAKASKAAAARWDARGQPEQCSSNAQASAEHVLEQCPPSPSPEVTDSSAKASEVVLVPEVVAITPVNGSLQQIQLPRANHGTAAEQAELDRCSSLLGWRLTYTDANVKALRRAKKHYTGPQVMAVLVSIRDATTPHGLWCLERQVALAYILRPGEKGGADKILQELEAGGPRRRPLVVSDRAQAREDSANALIYGGSHGDE